MYSQSLWLLRNVSYLVPLCAARLHCATAAILDLVTYPLAVELFSLFLIVSDFVISIFCIAVTVRLKNFVAVACGYYIVIANCVYKRIAVVLILMVL